GWTRSLLVPVLQRLYRDPDQICEFTLGHADCLPDSACFGFFDQRLTDTRDPLAAHVATHVAGARRPPDQSL
ncbi:MAG: hypothetical protein ABI812_00510, partial [Betaproteobacteria bacterium]